MDDGSAPASKNLRGNQRPAGDVGHRRHRLKILVIALAGIVVLVVSGTFVYINVIQEDAPDKLSLDATTVSSSSSWLSPAEPGVTTNPA